MFKEELSFIGNKYEPQYGKMYDAFQLVYWKYFGKSNTQKYDYFQ